MTWTEAEALAMLVKAVKVMASSWIVVSAVTVRTPVGEPELATWPALVGVPCRPRVPNSAPLMIRHWKVARPVTPVKVAVLMLATHW